MTSQKKSDRRRPVDKPSGPRPGDPSGGRGYQPTSGPSNPKPPQGGSGLLPAPPKKAEK